jgi:hypothetical protein
VVIVPGKDDQRTAMLAETLLVQRIEVYKTRSAVRLAKGNLLGERPRDGFYDTTAWSLPILYGVEAYWAKDPVDETKLTRIESPAWKPLPEPIARPGYVYEATLRLAGFVWTTRISVQLGFRRLGFS